MTSILASNGTSTGTGNSVGSRTFYKYEYVHVPTTPPPQRRLFFTSTSSGHDKSSRPLLVPLPIEWIRDETEPTLYRIRRCLTCQGRRLHYRPLWGGYGASALLSGAQRLLRHATVGRESIYLHPATSRKIRDGDEIAGERKKRQENPPYVTDGS